MSAIKYQERSDSFQQVIVEDLLGQINNWRNVDDVVRLTFKALTETVKLQGNAIRDLENNFQKKTSKQEVYSLLSDKASFQDTQNQINQLKSMIDNRVQNEEFDNVQKIVNKSSFDLQCMQKDLGNISSLSNQTSQIKELKIDINQLQQKCANLEQENLSLKQKISHSHDQLQDQLVDKLSSEDIYTLLDQKVSKQGLAQFLDNKVSKLELQTQLERKIDIEDLDNLYQNLKQKADCQEVEKMELEMVNKIQKVLNLQSTKLDKEQFEKYNQMQRQFNIDQQENIKIQLDDIQEGISDLTTKQNHVSKLVEYKANQLDFDNLKLDNQSKLSIQEFQDQQQITKQENFEQFKELMQNIRQAEVELQEQMNLQKIGQDQQVDKLNERVQQQSEQFSEFREQQDKFQISEFEKIKEIQKKFNSSQKNIEDLDKQQYEFRNQFQQEQDQKLNRQDFLNFKNMVDDQLENKVELQECQNAINTLQKDISLKLQEFQTTIRSVLQNQQEQIQQNHHENQDEIARQYRNSQYVDQDDFNQLKDFLERVFQDVEGKADGKQIQQQLDSLKCQLKNNTDLLQKLNIQKYQDLQEQGNNLQELGQQLSQVNQQLNNKVSQDEMQNIMADQALISEQLCAENIVGRWNWKSGKLVNKNQVPWEIQTINFMPQNYLWEKNQSEIQVMTPGLYQILLGFYCRKKPSIQILINGDPIMCAVNTSSYVVHHSSGKLKDLKHSSGQQITGLTLVDFIIVPQQAKICICYQGDLNCEGFLGLKRM